MIREIPEIPEIPEIAVVAIDCVAYNLTRLALQKTAEQIKPSAIAVFTDWPQHFYGSEYPIIPFATPRLNTIEEVDDFLWYRSYRHLRVSHILFIQYDGFVLDGSLWDNSWLQYDYIGAPWPWYRTDSIGNGGFSLRSTKLLRFLTENKKRFPRDFPEDETLCRKYRAELEDLGFHWAPREVANKFAFEREDSRKAFGFHGIFNMPAVLPEAEFREWKRLAPMYVRNKVEWSELP